MHKANPGKVGLLTDAQRSPEVFFLHTHLIQVCKRPLDLYGNEMIAAGQFSYINNKHTNSTNVGTVGFIIAIAIEFPCLYCNMNVQ